ncbi:hypothetical protein D3C87_457120 [compost metagenome]
MKNLKLLSIAIAGMTFLLASSCKKDNPSPTIPTIPGGGGGNGSIAAYFQTNLNDAKQTFTINAGTMSTVTGSKGTVLTFQPNSFVTLSGGAVTGNVQIELVEIYSKKDMILMNKQTMGVTGNGLSMLTSGGEFSIVAKQNGQTLKLAPGMSYQLDAPAPNGTSSQMTLFYGSETNDQLTWNQADSVSIDITQNGYSVFCDSLNWVNLDYFMSMPGPQTKIKVQVPSGIVTADTRVFVSVDGTNAVGGIYQIESGMFTSGDYYKLPIGMNVRFIVINLSNNTIQAAVIPATITDNHVEVVSSLTTYSTSQLADLLNNLP